ncbi:MAG: hypothetical protein IKA10_05485 [Oscillospiraceae bacterium]|nr:hypothetical protein [Oscillospiraceae bacterium]
MKILFATGKLNSILSATHKIVYQTAQELQRQGHRCYVCGFSLDTEEETSLDNGLTAIRWNSPLPEDKAQKAFNLYAKQLGGDKRNSARKSFMLRHPVKSLWLAYRYSKYADNAKRAQLFGKRVKDLVLREKFDAVVAVYMPFEEAESVCTQLCGIVPVCLYQADPWGLHRLPEFAKNEAEHIKQETALFAKADHIITTPALHRLYLEDKRYSPYSHKMTPLNFPNIKPAAQSSEKSVFAFDSDYTNLLFCGLLDDEYRSPKIFLQAAGRLIDEGRKIKIYFLGTSTSRDMQSFAARYPQNIIHHEAVSFDRAFATMKNADFLLNLSNTLDNQVPSKIFDYFSLGKPVVNVQKIKNCPSREYFDRYPLSFTFEDFAPDCRGLENFLSQTKGKAVDFETVKELFEDATVEYAARTVEKVLTDILNDK